MRSINTANSGELRLRKFWPVDRNSPIFEGVIGDDVLFDVAREGTVFNIAFNTTINRYLISSDVFLAAIESAKAMIIEAERVDNEM